MSNETVNLVVFLLIFILACYFYFTRNFNEWKLRDVPQLNPIPFFGNAFSVFSLNKSIGELLRDIYNASTNQPFIGFFICNKPCLLIRDPELVKQVLIKDFNIWNDRTITENRNHDLLSTYLLLILRNPEWKTIRKQVAPIFTTGRLKQLFYQIQRAGQDMVEYVNKQTELHNDSVIETRALCAKFTTNSITATTYGVDAECFTNDQSEFLQASNRIFNWDILERTISTSCYFIAPTLVKLFRLKFIDSASVNLLRETFWKTFKEKERTNGGKNNDVVDFLIDIRKKSKDDDLRKLEGDKLLAQTVQFFTAGFETSATTISFTLYELAKNPQVQTRLRDEIREVKKKYDGAFTYEALKDMTYLDGCIKETLRKYPPLPFLDRSSNQDYQIPGTEIVVKKGTSLFVSSLGLHYDPCFFPEPEKYQPERFVPENRNNVTRCTWLPFGDGPRNCFGARYGLLSSAVGVASIISEFDVKMCECTQKEIKFVPKGFLLAPVGGLNLQFRKLQ